jgi:hypothetical protein
VPFLIDSAFAANSRTGSNTSIGAGTAALMSCVGLFQTLFVTTVGLMIKA